MSNNSINNKVTVETKSAVSGLKSFTSMFSKLGVTTKDLTGKMSKLYPTIRKNNMAFTNFTKDANRANKSLGSLSKGFSGMGKALGFLSIYKVSQSLTAMISSAMDMIETANLFSVAMGEVAVETNKSLVEISKLTGLDLTNIQTAVGTYASLARSMGITNKQAQTLSTTTYRLALDLASLYNVDINQALGDLRSGLVGQSETVYKYGIDVTEASLKTEALAQGIEKSVRNMSQGEKMALRYAVMIRQTTLAQGDFARTIDQPANQLRILHERFITLGRSIGNMFIPLLSSVLPFLNAIVTALTRIINRLAVLFGAELPQIQNMQSGLDNMGSEMADNLDDATASAKKLKGQLMGFDEINLWTPPTEGAGAGGTGAIAGGTEGFELPTFDSMFDKIRQQSDILADALEKPLENILKLVGLIGIGFLSWKIADSLFSSMGLLSKVLPDLQAFMALGMGSGFIKTINDLYPKLLPLIATFTTIAIMITRTIDLLANNETFKKGLEIISTAIKDDWEWLKGIASELIPNFDKITEWLHGFGIDWGDVGITIAGVLMLLNPATATMGAVLLGFEAITLAIRAVGWFADDSIKAIDVLGEGISDTTKAKLQPFMDELDGLNVILKEIEWGNLKIDDTTYRMIVSKITGIKNHILNELDADRNEALAKLAPLKKVMSEEAFNELLRKNTKYYDDLQKDIADGEQRINDLLKQYQEGKITDTDAMWKEINGITAGWQDTGLKHMSETEQEYKLIMGRLKEDSVAISVEQMSAILQNASTTKEKSIEEAIAQYDGLIQEANRMKKVGAITDEEYAIMVENAEIFKSDMITKATEQYDTILSTAQEKYPLITEHINLQNGEILSNWDVFKQNAKTLWDKLWEDTDTTARTTYDGIRNDLETNNNTILANQELFASEFWIKWKTSWETLKTDFFNWTEKVKTTFSEMWTGLKSTAITNANEIGEGWTNFWSGVQDVMIGIGNGIIDIVEDMINGIIRRINKMIDGFNRFQQMIGSPLKFSLIGEISLPDIPYPNKNIKKPLLEFAGGGIPDYGQMFIAREAGAELVGGFGSKTAVMNNDQIVDAVSNGVYQAVASAMQISTAGTQSGQPVVLNIDGKEFARMMLPKMDNETKRMGFKPILVR